MQPLWHGSPNFGPRRGGARPELVVLHYTAMPDAEAALERLCDPAAEVSCHYLIAGDGRCWQLVREADRAWHAGAGSWGGRGDVNSRSIGIELDNTGRTPFAEDQMAALESLLHGILVRWQIAPEAVIGHADMAPERKSDPGSRFDWARLSRQGLACQPKAGADGEGASAPEPPAPSAVDSALAATYRACLTAFGYPQDAPLEAVHAAFRARFRPWARGGMDHDDLALAAELARRFPVDRGAANP